MNKEIIVSHKEIDQLYKKLYNEAEAGGYNLNPDVDFTMDLIRGLLVNEKRYGYISCPCRLASGNKLEDLDIICPCDYRDPDINEYGLCYCALYVSQEIKKGVKQQVSIPERRPEREKRLQIMEKEKSIMKKDFANLSYPIWRCRVCGYLCARDEPPEVCPICKVKKDRFERFYIG